MQSYLVTYYITNFNASEPKIISIVVRLSRTLCSKNPPSVCIQTYIGAYLRH